MSSAREGYGFVCFDCEGSFGMPVSGAYEVGRAIDAILKALAAHGALATFFVVGELALRDPGLLRELAGAGHELALHGYRHEHMARPGSLARHELTAGLDRAGEAIATAAGRPPHGFRAPYLLAPAFFDAGIYELLEQRGYRWASNWELRHPIELVRPDRIHWSAPWRALRRRPGLLEGRAAAIADRALNLPARRRPGAPSLGRGRPSCRPPFVRGGLLELPLYAPMDCDLVGLPSPAERSDPNLLGFAEFALERCIRSARTPTVLTFHDWIVAGAGRMRLLDGALRAMRDHGQRPVTVSERLSDLTAMAGAG